MNDIEQEFQSAVRDGYWPLIESLLAAERLHSFARGVASERERQERTARAARTVAALRQWKRPRGRPAARFDPAGIEARIAATPTDATMSRRMIVRWVYFTEMLGMDHASAAARMRGHLPAREQADIDALARRVRGYEKKAGPKIR